eukprot:NODE_1217_length_1032_cov_1075.026450_g843_i0.p2 GENE.NODE_1217_length_1032_cov_1075.026450_g843_i0~~NODE_1217_length_1032_cov_1075.026450_g843_i0.p2  ORF type:complete len:301 (+),score=136.36 NODE_1217_length_1032_cov_1075.026450_g843_i0:56-904(+)
MRGPKKHWKRLRAPSHWMLDKMGGKFAPRPRPGPHKLVECLPLLLMIRNHLKYALTYRETFMILKQRLLKVDGKPRTDPKYPAGFMDVITIEKTGDKFRLLYDTKGRYVLHKIKDDEVNLKLCKVKKLAYGPTKRPYLVTHDGRNIAYPDPKLKRNDTVCLDIATGKIKEWVRFKPGCLIMVTGGSNVGRVGEVISRERHPGSFDIVHVKDSADNKFATRAGNCFVIGPSVYQPLVTLPKQKGVRLSTHEDREKKLEQLMKDRTKKVEKKEKTGAKKGKGRK